jgi:hypothetical protein
LQGLESTVAAEGGQGAEEEELEWLSNTEAFPSVETMMTVEVEPAARPLLGLGAVPHVVGPRSRGLQVRRRVTKPWGVPPPPPRAARQRRCTHCASEETPQWRQGPEGPKTLCNACGVRFKSGRLFPEYRPINSPTFSPLLHSNSSRRVLEMRRRHKEEEEAGAADGGD